MKKSLLPSLLLLLSASLFAQKKTFPNTEKNAPTFEPAPHLDFTAPMVACLNGLSANVMPTGAIQLWASDFLLSVTDNVTPTDQIKIAIRKAGTGVGFPVDAQGDPVHSVLFDCQELGTNSVELWAKDLAGNVAHCLANIMVQDKLWVCNGDPAGDWLVEICAGTETADGIEEAQFMVTGSNPNGPFYANEVAGPNMGCGYFQVPLGSEVTAMPVKDDNPLNGVTTYDIVLISRHFRGIELLNSPYKIIAADANRDGLVTMEDSIELRNLILGIYDQLPNNTSWRFVDKSYVFPNPNNPFVETIPESITVQDIQAPVSANFIGIKVGDVNNTAVANTLYHAVEERAMPAGIPSIGLPYPNPTDGSATLTIYLPAAEKLRLQICDLTGKSLWVNDLQLEKGNHRLQIPASVMPGKGVCVWRVWSAQWSQSGKLVRT